MDSDSDDEPPVLVDVAATPTPPSLTNETPVSAAALPPCPVTILSGFLGSGKTTLVQYILKSPDHGKRIAVIENEFGEGLAVETLIARDGVDPNSDSLQDFIELPNGCICCTVKDSLVATLETLVERKTDLDYILIEASGMANPGPIASVFWLDDALESRLHLDGIVTLVDSHHILEQLTSTEEAAQQVAYADRLLINKIDLLKDEDELTKVTQALRRLHPTAPMQTTTFSKVPNLDWILNANCFGGASRLEELDTLFRQAESADAVATTTTAAAAAAAASDATGHQHHDHSHDHGGDHHDCQICQPPQPAHRHTKAITTLALQQTGSVSLQKLNAWLAEILWPHQDETNKVLTAILNDPSQKDQLLPHAAKSSNVMQLFRVKGIVSVVHDANNVQDVMLDDQERDKYTTQINNTLQQQQQPQQQPPLLLDHRRYIVQAVHDLWEVHPASDDLQFEAGEERVCKLVVIGKHLPKERLEQGFRACFVPASQ